MKVKRYIRFISKDGLESASELFDKKNVDCTCTPWLGDEEAHGMKDAFTERFYELKHIRRFIKEIYIYEEK